MAADASGVPRLRRGLAPVGLAALALQRAASRLVGRLTDLEQRLEQGDDGAWPAYLDTVQALAIVSPILSPERRGELLTTEQMAQRLGITSKTLLKHKARGAVRPALQRGKLIRWRGDEAPR